MKKASFFAVTVSLQQDSDPVFHNTYAVKMTMYRQIVEIPIRFSCTITILKAGGGKMQVEIKIDNSCKETKVIVVTDKITDEINTLVKNSPRIPRSFL